MSEVRLDKYLWSVRLFKTRSKSTEACKSGKVTIDGKIPKPSTNIKNGEIINLKKDFVNMTIRVVQTIEKRVGAKLVEEYMEDLTPEEEYNKREISRQTSYEYRERGSGRPTKKERREIDSFKKKTRLK